jgi:hypothetical protein
VTPRTRVAAAPPAPEGPAATYGTPEAVTARRALDDEIARTSAAVEWLREQIAGLTPDQLIKGTKSVRRTEEGGDVKTTTEAGMVRHPWLALYMEERRFLHALCRDGLNLTDGPSRYAMRSSDG